MKRRLEETFADDRSGAVSWMMTVARDVHSARTDGAKDIDSVRTGSVKDIDSAENTRRGSPPGATAVDAFGGRAPQEGARGSTTLTCDRPRKRQWGGGGTLTSSPFRPSGVVDLCDLDDLPVDAGASKDQPLDLCDSDDESDEEMVEHVRLAAEAEEEASGVVCIAVISPAKRSHATSLPPPAPGGNGATHGLAGATGARPISFCELEGPSPAAAAAALTPSPAWAEVMPWTGEKLGADNGKDKDKEKGDDGRREFALLSSSSLFPVETSPPLSPPLASRPVEQRGGKEAPTRPVVRTLPPLGVAAAVALSRGAVSAHTVAAVGGATATAAEAVQKEAVMSPPPVQRSPAARSLRCSGHESLSILRAYIQNCPEVASGATEEMLASGVCPPSGLCGVIMTELLKSR